MNRAPVLTLTVCLFTALSAFAQEKPNDIFDRYPDPGYGRVIIRDDKNRPVVMKEFTRDGKLYRLASLDPDADTVTIHGTDSFFFYQYSYGDRKSYKVYHIEHGILQGPFYESRYDEDDDGYSWKKGNYDKGELHGVLQSGQGKNIQSEMHFDHGVLHGYYKMASRSYGEMTRPGEEGHYVNGKRDGVFVSMYTYTYHGHVYKTLAHYDNGRFLYLEAQETKKKKRKKIVIKAEYISDSIIVMEGFDYDGNAKGTLYMRKMFFHPFPGKAIDHKDFYNRNRGYDETGFWRDPEEKAVEVREMTYESGFRVHVHSESKTKGNYDSSWNWDGRILASAFNRDGSRYYYNDKGELYRMIPPVAEQGKIVQDVYSCGWGVRNKDQQWVIPPVYHYIEPNLYHGLYLVYKNRKWGIVNWKGEEHVPCIYDDLVMLGWNERRFLDTTHVNNDGYYSHDFFMDTSYYLYTLSGKQGLMTGRHRIIIPAVYDDINYSSRLSLLSLQAGRDFRLAAITPAKYSWKDGERMINDLRPAAMNEIRMLPDTFTEVTLDYSSLYCRVKKKSGQGIIDRNGRYIVPPEYDYVSIYESGRFFSVIKSGKGWGIINNQGKEVVPPVFKHTPLLARDAFIGSADGLYGAYDTSGAKIFDFSYEKIERVSYRYPTAAFNSEETREPCYRVKKKGLWMLAYPNGKPVSQETFETMSLIEPHQDYYFSSPHDKHICQTYSFYLVSSGGKYRIINDQARPMLADSFNMAWQRYRSYSNTTQLCLFTDSTVHFYALGNTGLRRLIPGKSELSAFTAVKPYKYVTLVRIDEKQVLTDNATGRFIFSPAVCKIEHDDSVFIYTDNNSPGLLDQHGRFRLTPGQFTSMFFLSGGNLAVVNRAGKCGVADRSGNLLIDTIYDYIADGSSEKAYIRYWVKKKKNPKDEIGTEGGWILYDGQGKRLSEETFMSPGIIFHDGKGWLYNQARGEGMVISHTGQVLLDKVSIVRVNSRKDMVFKRGQYWGMADSSGKIKTQPGYDFIHPENLITTLNGHPGMLSWQGGEIITNDSAAFFFGGINCRSLLKINAHEYGYVKDIYPSAYPWGQPLWADNMLVWLNTLPVEYANGYYRNDFPVIDAAKAIQVKAASYDRFYTNRWSPERAGRTVYYSDSNIMSFLLTDGNGSAAKRGFTNLLVSDGHIRRAVSADLFTGNYAQVLNAELMKAYSAAGTSMVQCRDAGRLFQSLEPNLVIEKTGLRFYFPYNRDGTSLFVDYAKVQSILNPKGPLAVFIKK